MTVEEVTPGEWVHRTPARDFNWNFVYADQLPRIYNYFRFRLGREADVEDLTARTFEKAWRSRDRYRRDLAGFSTWLFSIARNVATDHLRSHRRHRTCCPRPSISTPYARPWRRDRPCSASCPGRWSRSDRC